MPRYLAIHSPREPVDDELLLATDLPGLAQLTGPTRWLRTYTPDLHDDRHVSLWEADSAEEIRTVMQEYHFFVEMEAAVFRVHEWGPDDVLDAQTGE